MGLGNFLLVSTLTTSVLFVHIEGKIFLIKTKDSGLSFSSNSGADYGHNKRNKVFLPKSFSVRTGKWQDITIPRVRITKKDQDVTTSKTDIKVKDDDSKTGYKSSYDDLEFESHVPLVADNLRGINWST